MNKLVFSGVLVASAALILTIVAIPYQVSQQIQESLFGSQVNAPTIIKPAYATGAITDIFLTHSDNLMGIKSYYYVLFKGSTASETANVKKIEFQFPRGFNVAGARVMPIIESFEGVTSISGQTVVYTLNGAQHANQVWRFSLSDVVNGFSIHNQISITLKDQSGTIVDGPANSATFTLTPITSSMIANNAVTTDKINRNAVTNPKILNGAVTSEKIADGTVQTTDISSAFVKSVTLHDDVDGNAAGWVPQTGGKMTIIAPDVKLSSALFVNLIFTDGTNEFGKQCFVGDIESGSFQLICNFSGGTPPIDLRYTVINAPT